MKELRMAIAQVFRKKGKSSMPEKDFVFAISLDMGWFSPKEAQRLLDMALESELLKVEKGAVKPTFDIHEVEIPKGFAPGPELLQAKAQPKGMFMNMVDDIAKAAQVPPKDIISQINSVQDRMGVDIEVAALIVARNFGADVSQYLDRVEEDIGKRYRK